MAALAANAVMAVAKLAAAGWTGSAAMLAEAIRSIAATGNQALLLLGLGRSGRPADARHPFGYARELYFWAFVVAVLLFSLGSGVALHEGIDKLQHPRPASDPLVNLAVLGAALLLEGATLWAAVRALGRQRGAGGAAVPLRAARHPALYTVVLESYAGIAGLVVAFGGLVAAHVLDWPAGDAIASIAIGLILALVAAMMALETKALIVGEAAAPEMVEAIREMVGREMGRDGPVAAIAGLRTVHLGPSDVLVAASLDFRDGETADGVRAVIARLDERIKRRFPSVRHLFLEAAPSADLPPVTEAAAEPSAAGHASTPGPAPEAGKLKGAAAESAPEAGKLKGLAALAAAEGRPGPAPATVPAAKGAAEVPRKTYPPAKSSKRKKRR